MLNEIHVEGAVTRTWTFQDVHFARIACRIDSGRMRTSEAGQRESEYITLRFEPPALARAASTLKGSSLVRATGYLSSREYDITLKSFCRSADGDEETLTALRELAEAAGDKARKPHVLNEVVVERFEVLEE